MHICKICIYANWDLHLVSTRCKFRTFAYRASSHGQICTREQILGICNKCSRMQICPCESSLRASIHYRILKNTRVDQYYSRSSLMSYCSFPLLPTRKISPLRLWKTIAAFCLKTKWKARPEAKTLPSPQPLKNQMVGPKIVRNSYYPNIIKFLFAAAKYLLVRILRRDHYLPVWYSDPLLPNVYILKN